MSKLYRIVTNSERSSFACPRRWAFRYLAGLTTNDNPAPLRMGSLWHLALAAYYRSNMTMTAEQVMADVITPWKEQRFAAIMSITDVASREQQAEEDSLHAALCYEMFKGYVAAWGVTDSQNWEVLAVEVQAARTIVHPTRLSPVTNSVMLGDKRKRRTWAYGGGLDMIVRNKLDGTAWLVEHKTTSESNLEQYLRKLNWDPQIRGYAWLMQKPLECSDPEVLWLCGDGKGVRLSGVIYNVARKKIPAVPALLKDGKRLSKAACDTTRSVFMQEIARYGFNPDDYADVLDSLRGKTFFGREAYPFTDPEIEDFGNEIGHVALDMVAEEKKQHHCRQTSLCSAIGMSPCQYMGSVCLEDGPMARRSYKVLGIRHVELHGEMAEPSAAKERGLDIANPNSTPTHKLTPTYGGGNVGPDPDPFYFE